MKQPISRRDFLRTAGAGIGALALGGLASACGTDTATTTVPGSVGTTGGSGGAGLSSATIDLWTHDQNYIDFFTKRAAGLSTAGREVALNITQQGSNELITRALAAYAADAATPDMLGVTVIQISRFLGDDIAGQVWEDLTDRIGDRRDEFFAPAFDPYTSNGRIYGAESGLSLSVFYYREDLFEQNGLSTDFETWDDLIEIGTKLYNDTGQSIAAVATAGGPNVATTHFIELLLQQGGNFFDASGELVIDSQEAVNALDVLKRGVDSGAFLGLAEYYGGPGTAALQQEQVLGHIMPDWYETYILAPSVPEQSGKWRIRALPAFEPGGNQSSVFGGTGFTITKGKENTEVSYELLNDAYLTEEGQIDRFKTIKYLPTMKSVWENEEVLSFSDEFMGGQETMQVYKELAPNAPVFHQTEYMNLALTEMSGTINDVLTGRSTPDEAIPAVAEAIRSQMN